MKRSYGYLGPGDKNLSNSLTSFQPVSRIGEITLNCFVDSKEWTALEEGGKSSLTAKELTGMEEDAFGPKDNTQQNDIVEHKPYFHEWASAKPGMIALTRNTRSSCFKNFVGAETAVPVIVSCAMLKMSDEINYSFAGIVRTQSDRTPDMGKGPIDDDHFTLAIGGLITVLNTSGHNIKINDCIEWTFCSDDCLRGSYGSYTVHKMMSAKEGPRRIQLQLASPSSSKIIGTAKTSARKGQWFDLLIKQ